MAVTSHDVAKLAGVSQPTVSRALRDDPRVAPATRERVRAAVEQLGYVASQLGRNLATRSTRQIAMVTDLDNPLYPMLIGPLHDRFEEHGFRMVLIAERGDGIVAFEGLTDRSVDGVVLTTTLVGSELSKALQRTGIPFVELNRASGRRGVDSITADNRGGGEAAAELLLSRGHRRIGAILGNGQASTALDREKGFRAAVEQAGVSMPDTRTRRGWFQYRDGEMGFAELMAQRNRPTAVFCVSDAAAFGAMNQARRMGLRVPDDVAIVGFDDLPMASWPPFDLTTIRVDLAGMAQAAADLLVRRLSGDEKRSGKRVFAVETVLRTTH